MKHDQYAMEVHDEYPNSVILLVDDDVCYFDLNDDWTVDFTDPMMLELESPLEISDSEILFCYTIHTRKMSKVIFRIIIMKEEDSTILTSKEVLETDPGVFNGIAQAGMREYSKRRREKMH